MRKREFELQDSSEWMRPSARSCWGRIHWDALWVGNRNRSHNRSKIMSNFVCNDLPLSPSTHTNGGTADHTGDIFRGLLVAHSPQQCHTDSGTRRAARHEVEQATRSVAAFKLLIFCPREAEKSEKSSLGDTEQQATFHSLAVSLAGQLGVNRQSSLFPFLVCMYIRGRNVLWDLDLLLNDPRVDVERRFESAASHSVFHRFALYTRNQRQRSCRPVQPVNTNVPPREQ
jgi:hypothetical protein